MLIILYGRNRDKFMYGRNNATSLKMITNSRYLLTSGCVIGYFLLSTRSVYALSAVFIQPIQVCDDLGQTCANPNQQLFLEETNKIWNQANIDILFLPFTQYKETDYLFLNDNNEIFSLFLGFDHGQYPNPYVLNMWFVNTIINSNVFGIAFQNNNDDYIFYNGIAIADGTFTYNGTGRLDTIAHEIGHNLGLGHDTLGAGVANNFNLMTDGGSRSTPSNINNIYPDGAKLDQLTQAQIAEVYKSPFVLQADNIPFEFSPGLGLIILAGLLIFQKIKKHQPHC